MKAVGDFNAGGLKTAPPKEAKSSGSAPQGLSATIPPVDGSWSATVADSKASAHLRFNLIQNSEGEVVGTYTSSLGGGGKIKGTLAGQELSFELTQSIQECPGIFKGKGRLTSDKFTGTYTGTDCLGDHGTGTFTMTKGDTTPALPSTPPAEPPKPQIAYGDTAELARVRYIFVYAEGHQAAVLEMQRVLTESGLKVVHEARQGDVALTFFMRQTTQGRSIMADVAGRAFRPNLPGGLRLVWEHRFQVARKSVNEQDLGREVARAFVRAYRRVNR